MASPLCEKPGAGSPHSSLKTAIILLCEELSVLSAHVLAVADRVSLQQPPQPQTDGRDGRAGESPESVHHTAHTSLSAATTAIPLFALEVTVSAAEELLQCGKNSHAILHVAEDTVSPKVISTLEKCRLPLLQTTRSPRVREVMLHCSPVLHGKTVANAATKRNLAVRQTAWPHHQLLQPEMFSAVETPHAHQLSLWQQSQRISLSCHPCSSSAWG